MEINGKKLDGEKVAAARERFERNRTSYATKGKLTFSEILERVTNDCNSLTAIGKEHNVTRQMMSHLYKIYFRDLFLSQRDGHHRQKVCTLKQISTSISPRREPPFITIITPLSTGGGTRTHGISSRRSTLCAAPFFYLQKLISSKSRGRLRARC